VTLLRVEGAALIRGGRLLFEGLDLTLGAGDAAHVTGANGSGKSSLIRMVAGLLKPSAGRVERQDVALADEGLALDRELPLRRALAFWGAAGLDEALAAFDLDRLVDVPVRLLSTGQARRARLARVVASSARLWLLDEPLSGLDAEGVTHLTAAMATHREHGGAILAASHVPLAGQWREVPL
jgi:heme exporter protein A